MKRVLLMLAATAAFACTTAVAQAGGSAGSAGSAGSTSGTAAGSSDTNASSGNQAAGAQEGSQTDTTMGKHHKGMGKESGKSGKGSTLTGCVSASPDSSGMYTLSNGKYKSGVEIGPTDKVKDHAGHQVALKGHWGAAGAAGATGENAGVASPTNASSKSFDVDSVKHISDTCKEAPGGGTSGHKASKKNKGDKTGAGTTTPQL